MNLDSDDYALIRLTMVELVSSDAPLDMSPRKNWVENAGNLPPYVRKLARGIMKNGHDLSSAISIAISRIKIWAAGGKDVNADTRAKAAKALAAWEALKAKNAAKQVAKLTREDGSEYIQLTNVGSFNTSIVRSAWDSHQRAQRQQYEASAPASSDLAVPAYEMYPYQWLRELWTDYIVVECEDTDGLDYYKVPYTVTDGEVTFGEPSEVNLVWQDAPGELNDNELALLKDILTATD